ncbi:MAG: chromate transporter [Clostridiales bacterium GWF2_38_85]|nr:MAG: chromate transporter [Clostridiales bacterium GWF2_38_85]HBL85257.1 chromate transporter [Clostridiales bacterium]
MIYLELFWSFLKVGLFSIGGGYAALPLIQKQIVESHNWLTATEFADVITMSQLTPGPIGVNAATFVGTRIAGVGGAIIATIGFILPSCVIVIILAYLYNKYKNLKIVSGILNGLRPAVIALIAAAGLDILIGTVFNDLSINLNNINFISIGLFSASLFILRKFKPNPIYVMVGIGIVGGTIYLLI